jgi:protein SCO1
VRLRAFLVVAAVAVSACGAGVPTGQLQGVVIEDPGPKPSFVLTDTDGQPYDFAARTEGKVTLLYFGYTLCPDICPVHFAQIAEVLDLHPRIARDIEVVFVTVDPDRDTAELVRRYLDNFSARFVGLSGTAEELRAAQEAAGVPVATFDGDGPNYTVSHAAWVIAYGRDGLNHAIYPFGTRQSQWENDLQALTAMTGAG